MATIRDVAREAGVGLGTVSRVISNSPGVAPETRTKIEETMRRLGYTPSSVARALSRRRTDTLAVILPVFSLDFYVEILRGIERAIESTDYSLIIQTVERRADRDRIFRSTGLQYRVDGVIVVSLTPPRAFLDVLADRGLPAVKIDGIHPRLPSVEIDREAALIAVVDHLYGLGHRRIAFVDRKDDPASKAMSGDRCGFFESAMAAKNLPVASEYTMLTDYSTEGGKIAVAHLLALPSPPTAIVAASDIQALGILEEAHDRGLRIPEDLAVTGQNDIGIASYVGLTTSSRPDAGDGASRCRNATGAHRR